jgi:hypothetical protein
MTSEEEYPFGYSVYKLIKGGYINNVSVSFVPDRKSIEYKEKDGQQVRYINASTLLEISAVNIGANPKAVITTAKSFKGAVEKAWSDGVLNGTELNIVNEKIDELGKEDKDLKITDLEMKIAELELQLEVKNNEENLEENIYNEIYNEYVGASGRLGDHTDDQTSDALTIDNLL